MRINPLIEYMAKALADFHLASHGGSEAVQLMSDRPNWHLFTNEAAAVFKALQEMPVERGMNGRAGRYGRAHVEAIAQDAFRS